MEVKEIDRVIISKPVASRPNCTGFRLELLAGPINDSLPPETAAAAIRPKTVRPTINQAKPTSEIQLDTSEAAFDFSSTSISRVHNQSTIFKPLAKSVSKATISLLANLSSSGISHQQALSQFGVSAKLDKLQIFSNQHSNNVSFVELSQSVEPPTIAPQMLDEELRMMASSTARINKRSCDGYNWRKYGQKQVKGSEYPRSYFKCTYPKCPMKKKVERSLDGQITEIVYKGEHNHPKPDHAKRNVSQVQESAIAGTDQDHSISDPKRDNLCDETEGFERQMENENSLMTSKQALFPANYVPLFYNSVDTEECNAGDRTIVDPAGIGRGCEEADQPTKVDDNGTKNKRRKQDKQNNETGKSGEGVIEPCILVHNNSEPEIMGDGFRWRKYGQKVVRGNPYPRSYYRCTSPKCNVRKHVERAIDDPGTFISTYEGKHNHEMSMKITNDSTTEPETQGPTIKDKQ
ncbi:unnamed protein product [Amaranthus hypochondriacus]